MNTISDLRRSLDERAHSFDPPDPGALLGAVQEDIASGAGTPRRRPQLVAAAAAVALVAGGGYALTQGMGEETGAIDPAEGWELVDGAPPEYAGGLALVDTLEFGAGDSSTEVPWPEGAGNPVFGVAWCEGAGESDGQSLMLAPDPADGATQEGVMVPCLPEDGQLASGPTPLQVLSAGDPVQVRTLQDIVGEDSIVLGVYREATVSEYPYPDQQDIPEAPSHEVAITASTPRANQADLAPFGAGVQLPTATVEVGADTTLTTWAGEPGRLMVAVNGTVITTDGDALPPRSSPGPWAEADPDLRVGYWHTWRAGASTREFDLSPAGLSSYGIEVQEGDTVQVAATGAFPRDAWQVGIDGVGAAADAGDALEPVETSAALPQFVYGMEQVAAVSVPADGGQHLLDLDEADLHGADPADLTWVSECSDDMALTNLQIGEVQTQCNADIAWLLAVQDSELDAGEPVRISVASGPEPVTVAAYAPREWADYPFAESADPIGDSASGELILPEPEHGQPPPEMAETRGPKALYREVERIGTEDLDDAGRAELTVPSSTDLSVWLATEGPARVQLEVDGTNVEELLNEQVGFGEPHLLVRDGWFSTWSAAPAGHELRLDSAGMGTGRGERDEPTVSVQVEAEDGADVELVFYEFVLEEDWQD